MIETKRLSDGSIVESFVRYECDPGHLLDAGYFAIGYDAHVNLFCMHGMDGIPKWNQTSLPECLAGKLKFL